MEDYSFQAPSFQTKDTSARPLRCLKMIVAYDGAGFHGWQRQSKGRTIQGVMEDALAAITQERLVATASGRTDAGVHAIGQVVAFETRSQLSHDVFRRALNSELPEDIRVLEVDDAPLGFDPIRECVRKRYRYVIQDGFPSDVFSRMYSWQIPKGANIELMQDGARRLIGTHDFAAFETAGSARVTTVRTVTEVQIERVRERSANFVWIEVEADGFLYNMVRNFAGTLIRVGLRKESPEWVSDVLTSRNRSRAGMTAPAKGLFLLWAKYDPERRNQIV